VALDTLGCDDRPERAELQVSCLQQLLATDGEKPVVYSDAPMAIETAVFRPGTRVRVTQQVPQIETVWTTEIEGTIVCYRQAKTGSWFAHSHDDKLWLDRLEIRKDDGELVTLNLDRYSVIEDVPQTSDQKAKEDPTSASGA